MEVLAAGLALRFNIFAPGLDISRVREIVVDNDINFLDVDTSTKKVGRNKDALFELLEVFELLNAGNEAGN